MLLYESGNYRVDGRGEFLVGVGDPVYGGRGIEGNVELRFVGKRHDNAGGSGHEGSPGWLQHKEGQVGNLTGVS